MSSRSRLGMSGTLRNVSTVLDMYESEAEREERLRQAFEKNTQAMANTVCVSCTNCRYREDTTVSFNDPAMMQVNVTTDWRCGQQRRQNICPDGYNLLHKEWELGGRAFNQNAHNHDTMGERRSRINDLRRNASASGQFNIDGKGVTTLVDKDGEALRITGHEIKVLGDEMMEPKAIFMSTPTGEDIAMTKKVYEWNDEMPKLSMFHDDGMAKDGYEQMMEERSQRDMPQTADAGTW